MNSDLMAIGCQIAEEIRDGKWNHISELSVRPAPACDQLIAEFARRCPGYTRKAYQQALADGLHETR